MAPVPVAAQQPGSTPFDGFTPTSMTPGSPAGTYALSGFDTVNLSNGHVNFEIPLFKLPGRGDTAIPVNIPIDILNQRQWQVQTQPYPFSCPNGVCIFYYNYLPYPISWNPYPSGLGSASVVQRGTGDSCVTVSQNIYDWHQTLTRLTFTEPDGTEHELIDEATGGLDETYVATGFNRGRVFIAHDGTDMVFTSDTAITDPLNCNTVKGAPLAGNLVARNGTNYRVDSGRVTSITDRNGNQVSFTYTNSMAPASQILDSLGRATTTSSAQVNGHTQLSISTPALGSSITVNYNSVASLILNTSDPIPPNVATLFPQIPSNLVPAGLPQYADVVSQIILPNGQAYDLFYNKYGLVARIVLPTGGAIEYDYSLYAFNTTNSGDPQKNASNWVVYTTMTERREYLNANVNLAQYHQGTLVSRTDYVYGSGSTPTVVSHYDGNSVLLATQKHYLYTISDGPTPISYPTWQSGKEYEVDSFDADGITGLRKQVTNWAQRDCSVAGPCWFGTTNVPVPVQDTRVASVQTTLSDSSLASPETALTSYQYDQYNNRTDIKESAYGSGSPGATVRETKVSYRTDAAYISRNMLSLPSVETIYDGSSNQKSQVTYGYDESAVGDLAGVVQHSASYSTSFVVGRGNQTSSSEWLYNPVTLTTNTLHPYRTFNIAGNVVDRYDARGVHTGYDYTDEGNFTNSTYAFPTTIKSYPVLGSNTPEFDATLTYSYHLLGPKSYKDINGNQTTFNYDVMDRLNLIIRPDSGRTTYTYTDTPNAVTVLATTDETSPSDGVLKSLTGYDGLGRPVLSERFETSDTICVSTGYDGLGRANSVSNPASACNPSLFTTTTYDGLSRTRKVTTPLGAVTESRYAGPLVLSIDATGKTRQSSTDALGRLIQLVENQTSWRGSAVGVSTEPVLTTNYGLDTLDNLASVSQSSETRAFAYDSLKRLIQATNPESGSITYSYDYSGNVLTKVDARSVTATSSYDGLSRITAKSYSGGTPSSIYTASPSVTYTYDSASVANSKGRLTQVTNSNSTTNVTAYTSRGFVSTSSQTTGGTAYPFSYQYNLAGSPTSITYPSGRTVVTAYDSANRPLTVSGSYNGVAAGYAASIAYKPEGSLASLQLNNGLLYRYFSYNSNLQPASIQDTIGLNGISLLNLTYSWGTTADNGNLVSATEVGGNATYSQSYAYDSLNRLTSASDTGWSRSFLYDAYGNVWVTANSGVPISGSTPTSNVYNTKNQIGSNYDAVGNQTTISGATMAYDSENHQISATETPQLGGGVETYSYDGDGRRVQKSGPSGSSIFVYNALGQLAAEYSPTATPPAPACTTCYFTWDNLGTARMVSSEAGVVVARHDYLPFGEEIASGSGGRSSPWGSSNDTVNQKFTGKERDQETGLDYFGARFYGSALGRFTSPDWSATPQAIPYADLANPQSLNLYIYMRNNPLGGSDADGHCGLDLNCWSKFGSGFADTTYRPIVQAVSHPIDTAAALGSAAVHPLDTAVAVKNAVVDTTNAALSGDPNAIGKVTGSVVSALATAGVGKAAASLVEGAEIGEAAAGATTLYRAVGSAEAESIGSSGAFSAAPNGTDFKGFFYSQSDAQSFGARMTQMTGDPHTVVTGEAPTGLINSSPVHSAATEGRGVLIKNEHLPQVKVKTPDQP